MDANHRDRIAFVRMASGKYTPGMKLKVQRTAKELRPTSVVTFLSQRREAVDEAYAGDIIGFTTHGGVQLGDTITDGANLQFTGLPFFAPELFMTVVLKNPLRTKQLQQGLAQLGEEGAIQVFRPADRRADAAGRRRPAAVRGGAAPAEDRVRLRRPAGRLPVHRRALDHGRHAGRTAAFTDAYPQRHGAGRGRTRWPSSAPRRTTCGWRRSASRRSISTCCASTRALLCITEGKHPGRSALRHNEGQTNRSALFMLLPCRNLFGRGAFVALAAALLLAGCGAGSAATIVAAAGELRIPALVEPGRHLHAGGREDLRCAAIWTRCYLWYDEIPSGRIAADFNSIPAYLNALLVRTPDAAGLPKDRFSAVLTIQEANALQASAAVQLQRISAARKADLTQLLSALPEAPFRSPRWLPARPAARSATCCSTTTTRARRTTLIAAFRRPARPRRVQDLVLDLRLNTGGFLYVALTAASMVTGPAERGPGLRAAALQRQARRPRAAPAYSGFPRRVQFAGSRTYPRGIAAAAACAATRSTC